MHTAKLILIAWCQNTLRVYFGAAQGIVLCMFQLRSCSAFNEATSTANKRQEQLPLCSNVQCLIQATLIIALMYTMQARTVVRIPSMCMSIRVGKLKLSCKRDGLLDRGLFDVLCTELRKSLEGRSLLSEGALREGLSAKRYRSKD